MSPVLLLLLAAIEGPATRDASSSPAYADANTHAAATGARSGTHVRG